MNERIKNFLKLVVSEIPGWFIAATIVGSATITCLGIVYNYINSKVLAIQIGCLVIICLGIALLSFREIWTIIKNSKIVQAMFLFVLISIVATCFSLDPTLSFYGHFERGTGLLLLVLTTLGGFLGVLYAHKHSLVRKVILYPLATTGSVLGWFTWIGVTGLNIPFWVVLGNSSGGGATMGNSSFAGTVLIMSFFVSLYLFLTTQKLIGKLIFGIMGFFTVINPVLITFSLFHPLAGTVMGFIGDARGATLSLVLGVAVSVGILARSSLSKNVRRMGNLGLGAIAAGIITGIVMLVVPGTSVHNYFVKTSGSARFIYWHMAVEQTKHHWLIGTGPETFRYAHEKYFDPQLVVLGEPWADKPHNHYVEIALTTGLLGLMAYLAIFLFVGESLWNASKNPKNKFFVAAISGLLVAYLINNIILFDSMTSMFLFAVIIFWVACELEWQKISTHLEHVSKGMVEKILSGIMMGLIIVGVGGLIVGEITKLSYAWDELFAEAPNRTKFYALGQNASGYGAGISFAQRADDYSQHYLREITVSKQVALKDIEEINKVLIDTMMKYPANMQSYIAMGNLALGYIKQSGMVYPTWVKELRLAGEGIRSLSPNNSKAEYYINQAEQYEKMMKKNPI